MELERVDTRRAYDELRERITTLALAPGAAINEQTLAEDLRISMAAVREALKLLAHDGLVVITPRHGLYVADVNVPDLQQLSEMRLALEALSARLAAERATDDDLIVLATLRREQALAPSGDRRRLLEVDHLFHQAIARAAQNKYVAEALERLFGLSRRLWYLALPHLDFLSDAVETHLELAKAIETHDADRAEEIMRCHVAGFYEQVRRILFGEG